MSRRFFEAVDRAYGEYAGFLIDREIVAIAFDFFPINKPDYEHVLSFLVAVPGIALRRTRGPLHSACGRSLSTYRATRASSGNVQSR